MKPFFTKYSGQNLRLVFAYQYLSIKKEEEIFHFVPIEGKEIHIDTKTRQISNLSEIFVFQRGNKFIRLPLYQFLIISNVFEHLNPIIDANIPKNALAATEIIENEELEACIFQLEKNQLLKAIDDALDQREEKTFNDLVGKLNKLYPVKENQPL